jgi:hypothetical protein
MGVSFLESCGIMERSGTNLNKNTNWHGISSNGILTFVVSRSNVLRSGSVENDAFSPLHFHVAKCNTSTPVILGASEIETGTFRRIGCKSLEVSRMPSCQTLTIAQAPQKQI